MAIVRSLCTAYGSLQIARFPAAPAAQNRERPGAGNAADVAIRIAYRRTPGVELSDHPTVLATSRSSGGSNRESRVDARGGNPCRVRKGQRPLSALDFGKG